MVTIGYFERGSETPTAWLHWDEETDGVSIVTDEADATQFRRNKQVWTRLARTAARDTLFSKHEVRTISV